MSCTITVSQEGNNVQITVSGEIDEQGAEDLKAEFSRLPIKELEQVTVDLNGVNAMGSSAIGKLLLFYKNLAVCGGRLQVVNLAAHLFELFKELKLDSLFSITSR